MAMNLKKDFGRTPEKAMLKGELTNASST